MVKKKKIKKKKPTKKKSKKVEMDESLREKYMADAYGAIVKPKPKRIGVRYTVDLTSGLGDITTPKSAFMMRGEGRNILVDSHSGIMMGADRDSTSRHKMSTMMKSRIDLDSIAIESKKSPRFGELDPVSQSVTVNNP